MVAALARMSLGSWLMGFRGCWPGSIRWPRPAGKRQVASKRATHGGVRLYKAKASMALVLHDPTYAPRDTRSLGERMSAPFIRDKRDQPFLALMGLLTATIVPSGVVLFLPGPFHWWLAALHLGLVIYFLGPFVLMLHNTSHRKLFTRRYAWLNLYIP